MFFTCFLDSFQVSSLERCYFLCVLIVEFFFLSKDVLEDLKALKIGSLQCLKRSVENREEWSKRIGARKPNSLGVSANSMSRRPCSLSEGHVSIT